jgi:hypothetical protein
MHQHRLRVACACQEHTPVSPHHFQAYVQHSCVITPNAKCFAPRHNHITSCAPEHDKEAPCVVIQHEFGCDRGLKPARRAHALLLAVPRCLATSLPPHSFFHSTHRKITQEHTTHSTNASRHRGALAWPRNRASITRARDKGSKPHTAAQNTHTHTHTFRRRPHTARHTHQSPQSHSVSNVIRTYRRAREKPDFATSACAVTPVSPALARRVSSPLPFLSR